MSLLPNNISIDWQAIKLWRESHKISQRDLAEVLGISPKSLANWESGLSVPETPLEHRFQKVLKSLFTIVTGKPPVVVPDKLKETCPKCSAKDIPIEVKDWILDFMKP